MHLSCRLSLPILLLLLLLPATMNVQAEPQAASAAYCQQDCGNLNDTHDCCPPSHDCSSCNNPAGMAQQEPWLATAITRPPFAPFAAWQHGFRPPPHTPPPKHHLLHL